MSRILVIGMGVPPMMEADRHAGPALRAAHFATALALDGHEVLLLAVLEKNEACPPASPIPPGGLSVELTDEPGILSEEGRRRIREFAPDAVIGVTVYAAALAARLDLRIPMWADVFGDIMSEAQAKASRTGSDWSIVHFWTLLRAVLESADRFSAVSGAQSHALVGQLGLAGRLTSRTAGETLVETIPCAAAPAKPADRNAARAGFGFAPEDFVLLVSGGTNTWCDVETLGHALVSAMQAEPRLRLLVTGGAIAGHDETSHPLLLSLLRTIEQSRVCVLGWTASSRLASVYAASDLALHIERDLYERRLGAENRAIEWLAHGVPFVTTARSETGAALVSAGLALRCKPADAGGLARTIAALARKESAGLLRETAERGRRWAQAERSYAATAAPLIEWCRAPRAAADSSGARLVRIGLVSQPQTSLEMLEAYVATLSVREIARRGARWLVRRALASLRRSSNPAKDAAQAEEARGTGET